MKKAISLWLALLLLLSLCACAAKHYNESNISELYDKTWIIGKNRTEIQEKYGEFHRQFLSDEGKDLGAYYVNYENSGLDPSYIHDTYFIEFNELDIAVDAWFAQTSAGG